MAADAFRSQMNSLGWTRRDEPVTTNASSPFLARIQSLNPFSDQGYVRLPTSYSDPPPQLPAQTRQEEDAGYFACELLPLRLCPARPVAAGVGAGVRSWSFALGC